MSSFPGAVTLLANYLPDAQESMLRFAAMMETGLQSRGVPFQTIRPAPFFGKLLPGNRGLAKWVGYLDKFIAFPRELRRRLGAFGPNDILHICDHSSAVYTRPAARVPHLVTAHDLLAVRSALGEIPENPTSATGKLYQRLIRSGLGRARRVACISRATRADLLRLTPLAESQTTIIHNGFNYPYRPMEPAEAATRANRKLGTPPERFILHVGGNQWYKNRRGVLGIYAELLKIMPNAPQLVLVGKEPSQDLRAMISAAPLAGRVQTVTSADNEDLRAFYSLAEALLFPSLMEGFGWPIIEAQACGCPVATTNAEPMLEAGGDAAAYLETRDWPASARVLRDLLGESAEARAQRVAKGFANAARYSSEEMIDAYLQQYQILTAQ
jgi:glycosyltransferase involved in cell wall biosynthesis